jgi:hypothetical protein
MTNVIEFKPLPDPLTLYLGKWMLDQISVSRNKISKKQLGEAGLKKLWACNSMEEMRHCLEVDPALAEKYRIRLHLGGRTGGKDRMVITRETITKFDEGYPPNISDTTSVFPILAVTTEGRSVVVQSFDRERGKPTSFVFRMKKEWLLVSLKYYGREAQIFPRSPVLRYYRVSETTATIGQL